MLTDRLLQIIYESIHEMQLAEVESRLLQVASQVTHSLLLDDSDYALQIVRIGVRLRLGVLDLLHKHLRQV